ncbi:MAG: hypothetical protein EAZ08_01090 [Cytophagales bacterium]|nr:MAG: hypothetical protein EAZ08_01090 [Cytophagales bacterium]
MDILDLVALMQKYAEENPEILEFEERETFSGRKLIFYSLNVKKDELKKYFFSLTHGYSGQIIGEIKCSKVDFLDIQGNSVIKTIENTSKELHEWIKLIQRATKVYNSSENNNRKGDYYIDVMTSSATPISFAFLNNLLVKDFFCIKEEIILENLENKKEIYFLGENGDGKTLLLQAILIAFKWHFIEHESMAEFTGRASDLIKSAGGNLEITATDQSNIYSYKSEEISTIRIEDRLSKIKYLKNIFAYGVNRRYNSKSENKEQYGFMTLFDDSQYLRSPVEWLLKIKLDETEESYQGIKLTNAVKILEHLLADNVKIKINGSKVKFIERGFEVDFNELSEGYKSVMTWVTDLVSRLAENQPEVKPIEIEGKISFPYQGIVLVDEISLHLHPKWEYELVRKLRGWFPNIQFIMTTHSPVTVLGASEEAVFFKVYKENGITKVKPYEELQLGNMRADQILTSEFFGLASARPAYLHEYMNLRKEILTKTELTKEDEGKLKKLEDRYGTLPTGETKEELKTMAFLQKIAKKLNVDDKN